jgi:hypothetical protein
MSPSRKPPQSIESHSLQESAPSAVDAIELLMADHREVEALFQEFQDAEEDAEKLDLGCKICAALEVHMMIEEEIFYPAFVEATGDTDLNNEALVEHDGAKKLIAEIQAFEPNDELFEAKVKVLSEMIEHHVKEEEQDGGMFAEARESGMNLAALGARLATRKAALEESDDEDTDDVAGAEADSGAADLGRNA